MQKKTKVTVIRSKMEIESTLKRYGATERIVASNDRLGIIGVSFEINQRCAKIKVLLPDINDFRETESGTERTETAQNAAFDAECRRRWRMLLLILKAKLEVIESGISTFEREFLADLLLSDGRTFGEFVEPQLEQAFESGKMPKMLLPG